MKSKKYFIFLIVIQMFLSLLIMSCSDSNGRIISQTKIKSKMLKKHKIKEDWIKLKLQPTFPDSSDEKKGHYFVMPSDITMQNNQYLLVVDNSIHKIFKFSLEGKLIDLFGREGQGPGELQYPYSIFSTSRKIYIRDGTGINIYDSDINFIKKFKAFRTIDDFYITDDDKHIFANCSYRLENGGPLIEEYNANGKIINSFGDRFNRQGHKTYDSCCFLSGNNEEIVVAFKYYPIIRRYTHDGNLINEFKINIEILENLEKLNFNKKFTNPAINIINLPLILAGVEIIDSRIFVLLHLPRLEILELDKYGTILKHYYCAELKNIFGLVGFCVLKKEESLNFYILYSKEDDHVYRIAKACPS